jgi:hypothetical protein
MIYLPRGNPVKKKVNPARINLPVAMEKLRVGTFTGYLRFDAPQGVGIILFQTGHLISSIFVNKDETERLIAYDAIARIFEISIMGDTILNIFRLSEDLVLGIHTLLHGRYLYKGQDLSCLDVRAQLERIKAEGLTVCLRVYAEDQTVLIFYDHGYALGFFHEGTTELEPTADVSTSVALLPGAKLDLLEICSADEIALADLMASADLRPIWQRARKLLLGERRKHEEAAIRSQKQKQELQRQHTLAIFKTIAGNHIGKFGVTQVEKAFLSVGLELKEEDMESFYIDLQRLARLVAGQSKIFAMIEEMKKQLNVDD